MTSTQDDAAGDCRKTREQHEERRLAEVSGYIGYQSHLYSRNAPDQKEDIAQIAREAVVEKLRDDPDCPVSHLKVRAKSAIINFRKQGKSVDGKLDESDRAKTYDSFSLDAPVTENSHTRRGELVGDAPGFAQRITEERALNRVSMQHLRGQLSDQENQVLSMRLDGASWQEVVNSYGYGAGDYRSPVRRRIEEAARKVLDTEAPTGNGRSVSVGRRNGSGRSF